VATNKSKPPSRPKSLVIAGKRFKILLKEGDEFSDFGGVDCDSSTIYIRKGLSDQDFYDTLLHEALHAIFYISGLHYSHFKGDNDFEEGVVRAIDNLYMPIIKEVVKNYENL
jgi:hypothetical protein